MNLEEIYLFLSPNLINWLLGKWICGSPLHCKMAIQEMLVDRRMGLTQSAHVVMVKWKVAGIISVVICKAPWYHSAYGIQMKVPVTLKKWPDLIQKNLNEF